MRPYVPLTVKTNFSFLEGASHPDELVEQAAALGLPAIGVCDRNGVHGVVRAHVAAQRVGIQLLLGAELTIGEHAWLREPSEIEPKPKPKSRSRKSKDATSGRAEPAPAIVPPTPTGRISVLAETREGWARLCRLLSIAHGRGPKGSARLSLAELAGSASTGVYGESANAPSAGVERPGAGLIALVRDPDHLAAMVESWGVDRVYALVSRHHRAEDLAHEDRLGRVAARLGVPLVAGNEVLYHAAARRPLQDVMACIRAGTTIGEAGRIIRGNAEHALESIAAMRERFADAPQLLDRTLELAERCRFSLAEIRYVYPGESLPDGVSEREHLRALTLAGARVRYPKGVPSQVAEQLERELELIGDLEYGGYFLTMKEIVEYCRSEGILCQGRGSAANSAVCYCLGITAIDPIRMDLLFERFLSRERAEPPDIDLDIEHERREQVIQWVYSRWGRRHAAMVANVIRYRARSAVREVGKVLGLPQVAIDRLSKLLGYWGENFGPQTLQAAGLDPELAVHRHLLRLTSELLDFPRHLSIHPGGFLLGSDPVDTMVPIEPASMDDRTVIQWDKYDVEDLGLFKVDLLGLGSLSAIRRCLGLLREHDRLELDMATIPADDGPTFDLLSRGDTVGVFQVESRAQMAMLPRLRPRSFYDLVVEVAIVRPGPIQGDMVHPYLRRRQGLEPVEFPHPALERVLAKTFGVPIFQEQVMKLAIAVADYTPGEADQLRRDMAAWRSAGKIEQHRERLVGRMIVNGIGREFAERVYSQIQGFGEYGFPESHAASFALIAWVTAWLRTHHLPAFTCALLGAQPMGFYSPATLVEDARRHGVEVRPIDVLHSEWDSTLEARTIEGGAGGPAPEDRWAMRMGLRWIKGLQARDVEALLAARAARRARGAGRWRDLDELTRETNLARKPLLLLAQAGALESFDRAPRAIGDRSSTRRDAAWAARGALTRARDSLPLPGEVSEDQPHFARLDRDEAMLWDYRTSLHSTRGHLLETLRPELDARDYPTADRLGSMPEGRRLRYVGLVICRQHPGTAAGVTFCTLEDETGFVNLVIWAQIFERFSVLARTAMLLGVTGRIQRADGVVHLIADELWEPDLELDTEGTHSRDFH
ncbi:error-prone DNA polymerase [Nannocystaceae bacterium ST9]